MSHSSPFSIKSTIELKFTNPKVCDFAYNSYLPEFERLKTKRSKVSILKHEDSLLFKIESLDITAFRATVSDIISLGKIVENTMDLIEPTINTEDLNPNE